MIPLTLKQCRACGLTKPLIDFSFVDSQRVARRKTCNACVRSRKQTAEYKRSESQRSKLARRQKPEFRAKEIASGKRYRATHIGRARTLWHAAKHRARMNGLDFDLTVEFIHVVLMIGVCQRTGIPFDLGEAQGTKFNLYAPSVDRKDPFGGYTFTNVQIVCNAYNLAKNQMTDDQFVAFCQIVVNRHGK